MITEVFGRDDLNPDQPVELQAEAKAGSGTCDERRRN
jgi:hypothetical protein